MTILLTGGINYSTLSARTFRVYLYLLEHDVYVMSVGMSKEVCFMAYDASNSPQKYREALLAHGPVCLALFDAHDLRLLAMNAAYETLLKLFAEPDRASRAIGEPLSSWGHTLEAAGVPTIFRTVIQTGIAYHNREFGIHTLKQGTTYWDWSLEPLFDEQKNVVQLHLTAMNITQHMRERQHIQQTGSLLLEAQQTAEGERKRLEVVETVARSVQASLDIAHVGRAAVDSIQAHFSALRVAIHTADAEQQVLHLLQAYTAPGNEAAFTSLQRVPYTSQLLIARARHRREPLVIEDEQTALVAGIVESDMNVLRAYIRGYVCVPLWFHEEFEGTLTAVFENPIRVDGPEVRALADCGMHIATALAHARIHTEVERERFHLHQVLDQLPEGILMIEAPDARISYANEVAARIFDVPLSTIIGHDIMWLSQQTTATTLDNRPLVPDNYAAIMALRGEVVRQKESVINRRDGSAVVTLASTVPLRSSAGTITETVTVFQDITERKSVEQQKNEFLSIASHELRTPITSIQAYAEILQRLLTRGSQLDIERVLRATHVMIEQCHHLTRMIEELLELSRIETARLSLQPEVYDVIAALRRFIENHALIAKRHQLRLILDVPPLLDELLVFLDKGRMEQVLNNLLSNAIKYSMVGSEVEIGLRYHAETPTELLLWVKDQGIGIAAEDLPHVFDRFHRASSLDRSITGFGIGLYLVKEFITRHNGRVWVESTKGKGSTFWIRLPLSLPPPPP